MHDDELLRMAAFKLRDCARRVTVLAREAESESLRQRLGALSALLDSEGRTLQDSPDGDVARLADEGEDGLKPRIRQLPHKAYAA